MYIQNPAEAISWAILTPDGTSYTRLDFTTTEHPHHRSVFFGVGDVTLEGTDIKHRFLERAEDARHTNA